MGESPPEAIIALCISAAINGDACQIWTITLVMKARLVTAVSSLATAPLAGTMPEPNWGIGYLLVAISSPTAWLAILRAVACGFLSQSPCGSSHMPRFEISERGSAGGLAWL